MEAKIDPPIAEVVAAAEHSRREQTAAVAEVVEVVQKLPKVGDEVAEQLQQASLREMELAARLHYEISENVDDEIPQQQPLEEAAKPQTVAARQTATEQNDSSDIFQSETKVVNDAISIEDVNHIDIELPLVEVPSVSPETTENIQIMHETEVVQHEEGPTTAIEAWEEVLHKEPAEIYEEFAGALEMFSELTPAMADAENVVTGAEQPTPQITTVITERLAELKADEKEPIALAMQDIIGALHGLQVLEARNADAETVTAVEAKLTQLCVVLFEQLEIDYTEQDIKDFVAVLRNPRFVPETAVEGRVDVKDLGTHETKYFAHMAGVIADAEDSVMSALGTFALSGLGLGGTREAA